MCVADGGYSRSALLSFKQPRKSWVRASFEIYVALVSRFYFQSIFVVVFVCYLCSWSSIMTINCPLSTSTCHRQVEHFTVGVK